MRGLFGRAIGFCTMQMGRTRGGLPAKKKSEKTLYILKTIFTFYMSPHPCPPPPNEEFMGPPLAIKISFFMEQYESKRSTTRTFYHDFFFQPFLSFFTFHIHHDFLSIINTPVFLYVGESRLFESMTLRILSDQQYIPSPMNRLEVQTA